MHTLRKTLVSDREAHGIVNDHIYLSLPKTHTELNLENVNPTHYGALIVSYYCNQSSSLGMVEQLKQITKSLVQLSIIFVLIQQLLYGWRFDNFTRFEPVSYTHLTLPTMCQV